MRQIMRRAATIIVMKKNGLKCYRNATATISWCNWHELLGIIKKPSSSSTDLKDILFFSPAPKRTILPHFIPSLEERGKFFLAGNKHSKG
ncbi:Von Willebrand Factor D And Egf Domain-Containing Protein [Manis pentadactyla]|nr:Von Willebrand Factor D And Egf Domain-Containing Protein [Manis pentadactyla]